MKIAVCQLGARHRYAIPYMFWAAGVLEGLYTDSSSHSLLGRISRGASVLGMPRPGWLCNREIEYLPRNMVHSTDRPMLMTLWRRLCGGKMFHADYVRQDRCFSRMLSRWDIRNADLIYSISRGNLSFWEEVHRRGIKNMIDVIISPLTAAIMEREQQNFPDWGGECDPFPVSKDRERYRKMTEVADLLLSPSQWVTEGLLDINPNCRSKIRLVPYGCSIDWGESINNPIPGKVLFCGGDVLRKGLPYLGMAATMLKGRSHAISVEVVGDIPASIRNQTLCRDLCFRGKLSRPQMKEAYLTSDVFVLPSLSEGFAGVIAEAVTAGVPCVVTKEGGSQIRDMFDGLVVPARDAGKLADAIERIVGDRELRNQMAANCLQQREYYSADSWKKRLLEAAESLMPRCQS